MSIFNMFSDRMTKAQVNGKGEEDVVITRRGKTINPQVIQNERMCVLQDDTVFDCGDLMVTDDNKYYIVAKQSSAIGAVQAHLRKINCEVTVSRLTPAYVNGNKVGEKETVLYQSIPSVQYTVTANMKKYDAGLLENTVKKYILPELDLKLKDRIRANDSVYEIIGIDDDKYDNILTVQCSIDTRKVV